VAAHKRVATALARAKDLARKWAVKSGVSVLDQGLVSGSNFLLALLLARWLSPAEYGTYAIAFSIFLFISGFHNALILDPMFVLGASRHGDDIRPYNSAVIWMHFAMTAVAGLGLAATALVVRASTPSLGMSLLGLALACPFVLFFSLLRSTCYVKTRPDRSLRGSLIYAVVQFGTVALMFRSGTLSSFSAFLAMGLAGFAAGMVLMISEGIRPREMRWSAVSRRIPGILAENWGYGKWIVGSAFVYWLSGAVYVPLVGTLAGLEEAGAFQAMQNLLRPLQQSLVALNLLFLPFISRQRAARGNSYLKKTIPAIVVVNIAVSCVYFVLLLLAQKWVIAILYRKSFYDGFARILPYLWMATLVSAVMQGLVIGLKTLERTDLMFWGQALGAAFTMTLGLYMVHSFKTTGAALGSAFTMLLECTASYVFLRRLLRKTV
jgi:O-antigen/teichoic acid export membrane protein